MIVYCGNYSKQIQSVEKFRAIGVTPGGKLSNNLALKG
jgi:hypothetical protein